MNKFTYILIRILENFTEEWILKHFNYSQYSAQLVMRVSWVITELSYYLTVLNRLKCLAVFICLVFSIFLIVSQDVPIDASLISLKVAQ